MGGRGRPGKDPPGEQVDHKRNVGESGMGGNEGEVREPDFVRCIGVEIPVQQVLGSVPVLGPDRGGGLLSTH